MDTVALVAAAGATLERGVCVGVVSGSSGVAGFSLSTIRAGVMDGMARARRTSQIFSLRGKGIDFRVAMGLGGKGENIRTVCDLENVLFDGLMMNQGSLAGYIYYEF